MQMILLKTLTTKTLFLKYSFHIIQNNNNAYIKGTVLCEINRHKFWISWHNKEFSRIIISFHSSSDESCDEDDDGELLPKDEGKI